MRWQAAETYSHTEFLGQRIDLCMFKQLVTRVVGGGNRRVVLKVARSSFLWEVFACVYIFEETTNGNDVMIFKLDATSLRSRALVSGNQGKSERSKPYLFVRERFS